ncbi:MAG: hypothetical protein GX938_08800 [Spirochaetales bacterium]|nr:hypothetical protein [Spirochaetales bacterium]
MLQPEQVRRQDCADGSILICDGELGLSEAFAEYASEQQRCHWHINRDLYYAMYQDGGRKADSMPIQDALAGALAIELPQEDFKYVSEKEKDDIEERMEKTESAIDQLIGYFDGHGYEAAATYMRRAKIGMFGYIRRPISVLSNFSAEMMYLTPIHPQIPVKTHFIFIFFPTSIDIWVDLRYNYIS